MLLLRCLMLAIMLAALAVMSGVVDVHGGGHGSGAGGARHKRNGPTRRFLSSMYDILNMDDVQDGEESVNLTYYRCLDPRMKDYEIPVAKNVSSAYKGVTDLTALAHVLKALTKYSFWPVYTDYILLTAHLLREAYDDVSPGKLVESIKRQNRMCAEVEGLFAKDALPLLRQTDDCRSSLLGYERKAIAEAIAAIGRALRALRTLPRAKLESKSEMRETLRIYRQQLRAIRRALREIRSNTLDYDERSKQFIVRAARAVRSFSDSTADFVSKLLSEADVAEE